MHEAAIAQSILERVSERAVSLVRSITIEIGGFRNVDPESLTFAFSALKENYYHLKEASLIIKMVAPKAVCAMKHEYEPKMEDAFRCVCGEGIAELVQGNELNIVEFTAEPIEIFKAIKQCTK